MSISNLVDDDSTGANGFESDASSSCSSSSSSSSCLPSKRAQAAAVTEKEVEDEEEEEAADEEENPKRGWVAPFLLHLHQMLRRESADIVRWTDDGLAFQILDKPAMTQWILPKYFKNKNFASFQRQLNYFGFRKWSKARAADFPTYSREFFCRDQYDLLSLVKRQSKKSKKRSAAAVAATAAAAAAAAGVEQDERMSYKRLHLVSSPTTTTTMTMIKYIGTEKCKPILPKLLTTTSDGPQSCLAIAPATAPALALAPPTSGRSMLVPLLPTMATMHIPTPGPMQMQMQIQMPIPVISPTRKIPLGCKLPSLRSMFVTSAPWRSCVKP